MVHATELMERLKKFGFTEYEAKTYIALIKEGIVSAPHLAKLADVPKSKVYETLTKLISRGMIEEYPGSPRKFKARSIEFVFDEMLKEEQKKIISFKEEAEELKKKFSDILKNTEKTFIETDAIIWTVNGRKAFHEKMAEMAKRSQKEVLVVSPRFSRHPLVDKAVHAAKARGIALRGIISLTEENKPRVRYYTNYFSGFRNFGGELPLTLVIVDEKECLYRVEYEQNGQVNYVGVHSTNEGLAKAFTQYWNYLWQNSKELAV